MNIDQYNGSVLAFIGDAIMTLKVREYLINKDITKADKLQKKASMFLSAQGQSTFLQYLFKSDFLTPEEIEIYKRGRNHKSKSVAKNADIITYRQATGLEALFGYWYLLNHNDRLEEACQEMFIFFET